MKGITKALGNARDLDIQIQLIEEKLQTFQLNKKFDVVLCAFSVIDYLTRKKDLSLMLNNVAAHMKKTSVFIFDFWNKQAVENYYTPRKKNIFAVKDDKRGDEKIAIAQKIFEIT